MYGFGDSREPNKETVELVEKILKDQLIMFLQLLSDTAAKIDSKKIGVKEFLILLRYCRVPFYIYIWKWRTLIKIIILINRHSPVKLRRFCKYLQVTDFKKLVDPTDGDKIVDDELSQFQTESKKLQNALAFLQHLDPTGYLVSVADPTRPSPLLDESMMERNQRIEIMTTSMDIAQYKEYTKASILIQLFTAILSDVPHVSSSKPAHSRGINLPASFKTGWWKVPLSPN